MNFQGKRDFSNYESQYQKVIGYLLEIQVHCPGLYSMLRQAPQFEYEVDTCRKRIRYARRYLSNLVSLVKTYQNERKVIENTFVWTPNEHQAELLTVNYYLDK